MPIAASDGNAGQCEARARTVLTKPLNADLVSGTAKNYQSSKFIALFMETKQLEGVLARYRRKLRERGPRDIILKRWQWYKRRFQVDNWLIGKLVELFGNRVTVDGVILSLDNPLVRTSAKSTLYFGFYETGVRDLCRDYLVRSLPTIEFGGSIGGVACTTNKLLENPDAHVVVECNPVLLPTLKKNREINQCEFTIEPAALAYGSDTISFVIADHFTEGRVQDSAGDLVTVPTLTLGRLLDKYGFETINLISDCEGAEIYLVEKESEILRRRVKCLIVETHEVYLGHEPVVRMLSRLEELGFEARAQTRDSVLALINRGL